MLLIFSNFLMFYHLFLFVFFFSEVKRSIISSTKHGSYELSHKLPDELGLTNLGN